MSNKQQTSKMMIYDGHITTLARNAKKQENELQTLQEGDWKHTNETVLRLSNIIWCVDYRTNSSTR
jgi:hypothetical protein